ncbi:MAG TPA: PQQ-binding-like beta-propeller repeat protein [Bryobacteraceae bacterium]|nr:PQQ-binding-like beta-propeller repeat protein [Bryobacteraceae bacterium]
MLRLTVALILAGIAPAQAPDAGRKQYESHCAACHGGDGDGGEMGPGIVERATHRSDDELANLIRTGIPAAGMPAFKITDDERRSLIGYVRSLKPRGSAPVHIKVPTTDGRTLEGEVLNWSFADLQLRGADGHVHLLRAEGDRYREVTSQSDWPGYHGSPDGNRFTKIDQVNKSNVAKLAPAWMFNLPNTSPLESTPLVVGGLMYATAGNECYALDAGSGREVWHYRRPRTKNLNGDAAGGFNRGVAIAGERLFMVTDNAHLFALNRFTGTILWDIAIADWKQNYNATSAPLIVGDLVVTGTAGGDEGVRGFVAAFDQATGKEAWRFWTVPEKGQPGSETWGEKGIEHPSAATWFTGSYDATLNAVYWPVGNPGPDYNGDDRPGDNLYSDSTVALDAKTGRLKWYFQYTPHDVWDWDAAQPEVLVDANWQGQPRKLLLHANRNGFFYVLDRTNGKLLLARPFVKKLTWAKEITPNGRPVLNANQEPTKEGTLICPAVEGATNWFSPSYNAATGLFYLQALEKCNIFMKSEETWEAGRSYYAGSVRRAPNDNPQKVLRAIDIQTGTIKWELPQKGRAESWGGTLATSTGLVFFCEDSGAFMAVDAESGRVLWNFQLNARWKASPMTYVFDHKQYFAVAAGSDIAAFAIAQ